MIKSNFHKSFSIVREENNVLVRFHHQATFLNKSVLKNKLNSIQIGDSVLLDFTNCSFIDYDIIDILNDFLSIDKLETGKIKYNYKDFKLSKVINEVVYNSNMLLKEGIYVIGFFFPVVPRGKARIRVQLSAAHSKKHLDKALIAFINIGKKLKII